MTLNGHEKDHFPKTDSCNENALFFTFRTQIVLTYFLNNAILTKKAFSSQPPKKHNFSGHFLNLPFPLFSLLLFCFLQHKKDKTKNALAFLFEDLFLDTPTTCQNIFSHPYTLLVILNCPQNTINGGKRCKQTSWTDVWLSLGQMFDSKKAKSWTDFWLYSIYLYIYIYIDSSRDICCPHLLKNAIFPQLISKNGSKHCPYMENVFVFLP